MWEKSGYVADKLLKEKNVNPGDRAMLVYPYGMEFVVGLSACMRAGVVAVSVYPPNPANLNVDMPKFNKFFEDCGAKIAVPTSKYYYISLMPRSAAAFSFHA